MQVNYLVIICMRYNRGKLDGVALSPHEIVFGRHSIGVEQVDEKCFKFDKIQRAATGIILLHAYYYL